MLLILSILMVFGSNPNEKMGSNSEAKPAEWYGETIKDITDLISGKKQLTY